ncbi:hypothetical protein BVG19_g1878 [[Candida] boidinii]|nr:hypothetical protein BVG19_g1878 [[Candida] boidinii]OWB51438.1 hypothetical protein B5S27_g2999 [[Candida] boidinii]
MFRSVINKTTQLIERQQTRLFSVSRFPLQNANFEQIALKNTANKFREEIKTEKANKIQNFLNKDFNGTTYDPFDFSIAKLRYDRKIRKHNEAKRMKNKSFNKANVNPLDFYCLPTFFNLYLNSTGSLLHRTVTGLKGDKQRKLTKAVKRARAAGYLSSVSNYSSSKRGITL